jgi:preprotein translocase subunit SecY
MTLLLLLVYRLGSYVSLPGIDPAQLTNLKQQTSDGLLGLLDMFSGGAFSNASIFALGIMPYISASIVVQLLGIAVPYFQRLQKEGESGRRKINQITRYLTVFILIFQSPAYLTNLPITGNGICHLGCIFHCHLYHHSYGWFHVYHVVG